MESTMSLVHVFLQLLLIINISFCNGSSSSVGCIPSERRALLKLKQDLNDPSNRLVSWTRDGDCCQWACIVCHNSTGHVIQLNLRNPFNPYVYEERVLRGKINPSLLDLKKLTFLDLSGNHFGGADFEGSPIPEFLDSMMNLRYLNLSGSRFGGMIPTQLGNLSNLQYLDLHENNDLEAENLSWLSGLSLLKHLDLSSVNLTKASDWLLVTNALPSLVTLYLSGCYLPPSPHLPIANFSSLSTLDLSQNKLGNSLIPSFVFSLHNVAFLDLGSNDIQGLIFDGFQNLTSLEHLDLSSNRFNSIPNWFSKLTHLEYLDLSFNELGTISSDVGNMISIKTLDLQHNTMEGRIPRSLGKLCNLRSLSLSRNKLSQEMSEVLDILTTGCVANGLEVLDLNSNQFSGHLTNRLGNLKNIHTLDLRDNSISGPIPSSLGELLSLNHLYLSYNKLSGQIPSSLGELSSLELFDVSHNNLSGQIPSSLGELTSLEYFYVSHNKLNGTLSDIHFANLNALLEFDVSGNSITCKLNYDWDPPFQLRWLGLRSCHLGPRFPLWLLSQKNLASLDISNLGIIDTIPSMFWKYLTQLYYINISHNQLYGHIPNLTNQFNLRVLDLSSNNLTGQLPPLIFYSLYHLDLSKNAFSGSIFHLVCNVFIGSYGYVTSQLRLLKLGDNFLSGELPDCWMNFQNLEVLNLANNKFTSNLPVSIGTLSRLQSLHLRKNSFFGTLPASLQNFTELVALDIGENEFVGNVPRWIGERFSKLAILNLRSNKFHGHFPTEFCRIASLQIIDVAYNDLSGTIPSCIKNFSAMVTVNYSLGNYITYSNIGIYGPSSGFTEDALLVMKGKAYEYSTILNLVRSIDLSKNNFSGEIPKEVTNLKALLSLNLSHNSFTGRIPENIGFMTQLFSLDLSANKLYDKIPQSLSSLASLSHLNLSYNKLIGKIPSSTQLQSLDASGFIGNELCGSPLPTNCTETDPTPDNRNGAKGDGDEQKVEWFYVSMALGFVVGFWSFIGPLIVNKRWRYKYGHFLDGLWEKLYV